MGQAGDSPLFLRGLWYMAALAAGFRPGGMRREMLLGEPVVIGRMKSGEWFALRDICPHRGVPLSAGKILPENTVECPYHGWRFRGDGICSAIPSLVEGQDLDPGRIKVRSYPVREQDGLVWVYVAAKGEAPATEPPRVPVENAVPRWTEIQTFHCSIDHAVIGLMDPAHGPYVHQQWWWRSKAKQLDKAKLFEPREAGFAMARHAPSKNSRAYRLLGGAPQTEITFRLPGLRWEHIQVGARQVLSLTCLTPLDAKRTRITQIIWSDHPVFALLRPVIGMAARAFLRQDGAMVDLQNQGLRYGPTLLWIDDADRQAKWYQALKREWAAAGAAGRPFKNPVKETVLRWRS